MKKSYLSFALLFLLLSSCVTINIYFPAAAAEEVADEIIHGIQDDTDSSQQTTEPEAALSPFRIAVYKKIDQILLLLFNEAQAAGANLDVNTPDIRKLRSTMTKRFAQLQPLYDQGYIGIQKDGLLTVKDPGNVPLKERNKVKKLVAAENKDRNNLYAAIANANGHPEWASQIKNTFANRWIKNAHAGWWYQQANGAWKQK